MTEESWPTIGKPLDRSLTWLLETKKGKALAVIASIAVASIGIAYNLSLDRGLFGVIGPVIAAPPIVIFSAVYIAIFGHVSDFITKLLADSFLSNTLSPSLIEHRRIYITISGVVFALVTLAVIALMTHA
jgi:hypothetical protein